MFNLPPKDKRRIQENIAKKRRQIEEEKLKLQYMKKKTLREQWLMDGLSQQSEEEQETMRLQAQDEQQQSDQLQSHIFRQRFLSQSIKRHPCFKTLTIAETLTAWWKFHKITNITFAPSNFTPIWNNPDFLMYLVPKHLRPEINDRLSTFAMEINVEHDKRTGKNQVVSTTTITPENIQERGLKVYDDGRKSIYALHKDRGKMHNEAVRVMTPTEVEELLHQATEKNVPTEVQFHQPVYSIPYTASSRPATPRTPRLTPTPGTSPFQSSVSSKTGVHILREESQGSQDLEKWKTTSKSPSPSLIQQDSMSRVQRQREETKRPYTHIPGESKDGCSPSLASHKPGVDREALTERSGDVNRHSPFCAESIASLNLNTLPEELESEPVTMIFMGYENADDEDVDDIQAELVIISGDDDDEAHYAHNRSDREACLSYHPEGYKSKVFQPKVGIAMVTECRDVIEDTYINWEDLGLHKPTFTCNPERHGRYLQGQKMDESENTGSIHLEERKLCSTRR
uniref:Palmdelphin n=1 Tax=Cyclopterus lumpus TaxID=8103 RepID=A0A8C3G8Y1_CYCLU